MREVLQRVFRHLPYRYLLLYAGVLLASLYVFAELAGEVFEKERFAFDAPLLVWFHGLVSPPVTALALGLTFIGSVYVLAPLGIVLLALLWRRSRRAAVFFALGFGGAVALNLVVKAFFARVRPDLFAQLSPESSFSFPSGHTMGSTAFFLALFLIVRQLMPRWQGWMALLGLVLTLGIGLSRLYLQVHYPSDILAAWALSSAWVLGLNVWYARLGRGRVEEAQGNSKGGQTDKIGP